MLISRTTIGRADYPGKLRHLTSPPRLLYYLGKPLGDLDQRPTVAIIGSRRMTTYGRQVTEELASGLARYDIPIISGLAIGVDGLAHRATLAAGGRAVAVLANGLDRIYPAANHSLGLRILEQGGTILSEYPEGTEPFKSNFIARNRLISGLANAVLITEASIDSGSLHTAGFALQQGRDVLAVPGDITKALSVGTNNLLKRGAIPITSLEDILQALNVNVSPEAKREILAANQEEATLLRLLSDGVRDGSELLAKSKLEASLFNQTLTMMEITNKVKSAGNDSWVLY